MGSIHNSQEPKRWWHEREFRAVKLFSTAPATFVVSFAMCYAILRGPPLSALWVPFTAPYTAVPAMFVLGFVEQRMRAHVVPALLSAVVALVPPWLLLGPFTQEELARHVVPYLLLTWALALVGSMMGIAASRLRYTIVVRPRGTCPGCGYCLKGLPANVCPECGRPFTLEEIGASGEDSPDGGPGAESPAARPQPEEQERT